jgi:hypothetical protein
MQTEELQNSSLARPEPVAETRIYVFSGSALVGANIADVMRRFQIDIKPLTEYCGAVKPGDQYKIRGPWDSVHTFLASYV